jgi:hypothetical protein
MEFCDSNLLTKRIRRKCEMIEFKNKDIEELFTVVRNFLKKN